MAIGFWISAVEIAIRRSIAEKARVERVASLFFIFRRDGVSDVYDDASCILKNE